ncbi:MAG: hypothetical protein MZV63_46690 [Marinilabiliales bacterium]|nr:hypothetical protein [Marinilabiliales bacterium]
MFLTVYLAAAAAALFYAIFPVIGAFVVREQWRQFRKSVAASALPPELGPAMPGSPCTARLQVPGAGRGRRHRRTARALDSGQRHGLRRRPARCPGLRAKRCAGTTAAWSASAGATCPR